MSDETTFTIRGRDITISDGFHSIDELYAHRIELFIALCRKMDAPGVFRVWRSLKHADNSMYEGWFILGIHMRPGEQITYHLPITRWQDADFAETRDRAPEWDGHTAADVLQRLKTL